MAKGETDEDIDRLREALTLREQWERYKRLADDAMRTLAIENENLKHRVKCLENELRGMYAKRGAAWGGMKSLDS